MSKNQQSTTPSPKHATPSPQFIAVNLVGGPYDGQQTNVPTDEFLIVLWDRGKPHHYHRVNDSPVFRSEDALAAMFGGKR